jgi:hypothetical protein
MRLTRKRLLEKHKDEYDELRQSVEKDLYPGVVEAWDIAHGMVS